ncbi:unnamed protein product [Rhizophagus irregularis]|nr:unnamed protein product [Rhizophagus irregularis]
MMTNNRTARRLTQRLLQPAISPLPYSTVVRPQVVYFVVTTQTGSSRLVSRITPYGGYQPPGITNQDPKSRESNPITMLPVLCTNTLVGLRPNRRSNYHKDIAPSALPSRMTI